MYKIDLHSHSIISHDGGLTAEQYKKILDRKLVDYIAVTDHNQVWFAKKLKQKFGDKIIIGEEIQSSEGEIIGLFLEDIVPPSLSAQETIARIHTQGGLVCIPHPFEIFRKGMQNDVMEDLKDEIDIIETFNARGKWRGKSSEAEAFVHKYKKSFTASSDAHCVLGAAAAYSYISAKPTNKNLQNMLISPELHKQYAPLISFLCPIFNRIRNKLIIVPALTE